MPHSENLSENNLQTFIETISTDDILDWCDAKIYYRGQEYYKQGLVIEAAYNSEKSRLTTTVKGGSKYIVTINLLNDEMSSSCTCPYGGICKHTVASLLYAKDKDSEFEISPDAKSAGNETKQYLQFLTKEELIRLVMKYAPEQFFVEVENKFSSSTVALNIFKKVESDIHKLFEDDELLYNPGDFEETLTKKIKKLSGLGKHLKAEIEGLIIYIIHSVEEAINNGYLYDDYGDSNYEPSDEFDEFVASYVICLSYEEKTAFLIKLEAVLNEQSYDTFGSINNLAEKVFTDSDLPFLKDMLVTDYLKLSHTLVEKFYEKVRELLTNGEKANILIELKNSDKWLIELANLFDSQNETQKAINVINDRIVNSNGYANEEVYILYLDLLNKANLNISEAAKNAISHCSTCSMLKKIASLISKGLSVYESILEQKNAGQLLEFLEANDRLPEALALIKRSKSIWDDRVLEFFKKHKKDFPIDAEKHFVGVMDNNLEHTGNSYYYIIADTIKQIREINRSLANEYLRNIQVNYKRRRNLIDILSNL